MSHSQGLPSLTRTFALAVPDTKDCDFFLQKPVFWVQHLALFFAPMILLWNGRWPVLESDWVLFFASATCYAAIGHYNLQMISGILSGINVNYTITPPPGLPSLTRSPYLTTLYLRPNHLQRQVVSPSNGPIYYSFHALFAVRHPQYLLNLNLIDYELGFRLFGGSH